MQDKRETSTVTSTVAVIGGSQVCWQGREPALSDMLADPITQLLMRRDGVQEGEVRRLVARLRQRRSGSGTSGNGFEEITAG